MNQPSDNSGSGPPFIPDVLEQHAQEAAFVWLLRDAAVDKPHCDLKDLARLDDRMEAHLDGLRVAGEPGRKIASAQVDESGDPGAFFVAGVLAFEKADAVAIESVVIAGTKKPEAARGLISALGWLPYEQASRQIKTLLAAADPTGKRVAIAASAIHRRNPGPAYLTAAYASDDALLKARALRAAGELGLVDLQVALRTQLRARNPACRFWAAWSLALLTGQRDAVAVLQSIAETGGRFSHRAVKMAMRRLAITDAKLWLKKLIKDLRQMRVAVIASGALGDPEIIPWLIEQMKVPKLARVAGEAFSLITGVNIASDKLEGQKPEGFEAGPTEDPADGNVAMDPDDNLAWPDPALVKKWWEARRGGFSSNTRYLLGQPIAVESIRHTLTNGYQRQRSAAAMELAILKPGRPLFETRAPALRQQHLLLDRSTPA